jgi:guanylate kinase
MSRITTASQELRAARLFDYVVFNENERLDETLATLDAIMTAENCRITQRNVKL